MAALPLGEYTRLSGSYNLSSYLPDSSVPPDLGPKCYCAYGAPHGPPAPTTNLHVDMADAVNVLVHVEADHPPPPPLADAEAAVPPAPPAGDVYGQSIQPTHGAVWHVFSQSDTLLLQAMLPALVRERGVREGDRAKLDSTHPLLDGCIYLDDALLAELYQQAGIVPYVVMQRLGDALLVPAGCAHQVRNLRSCVKVAADFVAPEHVDKCVSLTEQLRKLPSWHHRRADVLNVRSILLYAACACLSALDEHRRREEQKRDRQRRANAAAARTASANPPLPPLPPPTDMATAAKALSKPRRVHAASPTPSAAPTSNGL